MLLFGTYSFAWWHLQMFAVYPPLLVVFLSASTPSIEALNSSSFPWVLIKHILIDVLICDLTTQTLSSRNQNQIVASQTFPSLQQAMSSKEQLSSLPSS